MAQALLEPGGGASHLASQDVANTAWALSRLGWDPPDQLWVDRLCRELRRAVQYELAAVQVAGAVQHEVTAVHVEETTASGTLPPLEASSWGIAAGAAARPLVAAKACSHITATLLALGKMGGVGGVRKGCWPGPDSAAPLLHALQLLLPYSTPEGLAGSAAVVLLAAQVEGRREGRVPAEAVEGRQERSADNGAFGEEEGTGLIGWQPDAAEEEKASGPSPSSEAEGSAPLMSLARPTPNAAATSASDPPPFWPEGRELQGALLLASARHMHSMPPRGLVQLAWALTRLGCKPHTRWLYRYVCVCL